MNKAWSVNVCLGNDSTAETRLALAAQTPCAPNNTNYHVYIIIKTFSTQLFDLLPFESGSFEVRYIPKCFRLLGC